MSMAVPDVLYIPIHTGRLAHTQLRSYDTNNTRSIFHSFVYVLCSIITHQHLWAQRQAFSTATAPQSRRLLSVSKLALSTEIGNPSPKVGASVNWEV